MKRLFLLADDDRDDAELFGEALAAADPSVEFKHVDDGESVFEYLGNTLNKRPDIIFLDVNLPEINGWQCLSKLKNQEGSRHVPVIMYSTSSSKRDRELALQLGAAGYLSKPNNFRVLLKALDAITRSEIAELQQTLQAFAE